MSKSTANQAGRKTRRRPHVRPGDLPTPYERAAVAATDPIAYLHDLVRRLCEMRAEVRAVQFDPDGEFHAEPYIEALAGTIAEGISDVLTAHNNLAVWMYDNAQRYPFASGVRPAGEKPVSLRGELADPIAYLVELTRRWAELRNELHYVKLPEGLPERHKYIHEIQECIDACLPATFDLMTNFMLWHFIESEAADRACGAPEQQGVDHG